MTILYGVSPIGLGHASRAVAVGFKLRERGLQVRFASGGRSADFIRSYGFEVEDIVTEPIPSETNGVMRYPALWYIRYWAGYRATMSRMRVIMDRLRPGLVVGDEEFSCITLALRRGLENVLISDELELGFARGIISRYLERRVSGWYLDLQRRVSRLVVPEFGSDTGNVLFVGPVVRPVTMGRDDVLRSLGLAADSRMILLSASGSGIGDFLLDATLDALRVLGLRETTLVVTGLEDGRSGGGVLQLGRYRDNQNLVAAADLVISTAGKSTIDESVSSGSPMIAIPIKNHFEQERNAASLGFKFDDRTHLQELIPRYLGRRTAPRAYAGAESIAAYIASVA